MGDRDERSARNIFNIGSQQAANINNVAGDMILTGGQHGAANLTVIDARREIRVVRQNLDQAALPPQSRLAAGRALEGVEEELDKPEPDRGRVAGRLEELTRVLASAGALAGAGGALVQPLRRLASWLGPLGLSLLRLLPL